MASKARIEIQADGRNAEKEVGGIRKSFANLKQDIGAGFKQGLGIGAGLGAFGVIKGAVQGLFDVVGGGIQSLQRIEQIGAQTDAAIRSTGGAANVTRAQIDELAGSMESLTGIEAESITEGQNLLLTFTKVRNEVGAGNDIFDQATRAMVDMSVALGTDAAGSAVMLGKALNDPIGGITAMTRAGIQFTDQQKEQIKAMVQAGDVMGAQKVILAELTTQFGGSAEAFGETAAGEFAKLGHELGTLQEELVQDLLPVLVELARFAKDVLVPVLGGVIDVVKGIIGAVADAGQAMGDLIGNFGRTAAGIEDDAFDIGKAFQNLLGVTAAITNPFGVAIQGMAAETEAARDRAVAAADDVAQGFTDLEFKAARALENAAGAVEEGVNDMAAEMGEAPGKMADELLKEQFRLTDATEQLVEFMKEALSPAAEVAQLQGFLASKELAQGLASNIPLVRQKAEEMRDAAMARLGEISGTAAGIALAKTFAAGIDGAAWNAKQAAARMAAAVAGFLPRSEPKEGPLRGITKVGGNIVKMLSDDMRGALSGARQAGSDLASALVPRPVATASVGMGSGAPVTIQLQLDGRTVAEVVDRHLVYMNGGTGVLPRS